MSEFKLPSEIESWLASFKKRHGRAPRILHIGNIANNAYNNAKMLNKAGLDCDVICYDYYHLMGCPEWEDADFEGCIRDQFFPDWTNVDLKGFQRPMWFAQGPLILCADYLIARRSNKAKQVAAYWGLLGIENKTQARRPMSPRAFVPSFTATLQLHCARLIRYLNVLTWDEDVVVKVSQKLRRYFSSNTLVGNLSLIAATVAALVLTFLLRAIAIPYSKLRSLVIFQRRGVDQPADAVDDNADEELINLFKKTFPDRQDPLAIPDLTPYQTVIPKWRQLFEHYDLVQAYATDPILPLLAGKRPYIGFEHGTLRAFTLSDNAVCRMTSLAYNRADHVFITNGDCLQYALNIGVKRYTPMLHPLDESRIDAIAGNFRGFHDTLGVKYVFLCTLRHDWAIKGTDKYIRALPQIRNLLGHDSFVVLMAKWGAQISDSLQLARELDVESLIRWIEPLPKARLIKMQKSVDILFDQIALPHFGATAPEGIAAGVPVIMSYNPKSTEWLVGEPAPILSAWTVDEIVKNVEIALDPTWRAEYRKRAAAWIDGHHNSSIVLEHHLNVYRQLIPT